MEMEQDLKKQLKDQIERMRLLLSQKGEGVKK
jgi:hypothetical protein